MAQLEDLVPGLKVRGLLPDGPARVIQTQWHGPHALTLTYADGSGRTGQQLLYRRDEERLTVEPEATAWSLDADGHLFRLASEAKRISLAYLFDPFLAVQTSILEALPHQIQAVYHHMLPRQPLRFLLADDPGAGKTIMAGLFIKELIVRGDVDRCLVIAPGSLVEQWQDELWQKFRLEFDILTRPDRDKQERKSLSGAAPPHRPARSSRPQRGPPGQTRLGRLGPDRDGRGAQALRPP